ncbi:MAG TPA: ParA family protein [Polyangiaceae bacterium]|nr:ParA family protein [Polyangiaceae bacterium]
MITVAFFNNTGGVGKTSLVYHLAWALSDLNVRVLLADLDPQANLTALCLPEERLGEIWSADEPSRQTIVGAVCDLRQEIGDLRVVPAEAVSRRIGLLVGDVDLATFEEKLSEAWPKCLDGHEPSDRATSAFYHAIRGAAEAWGAHVALIDVGPNLSAINRSALLAAEWVVTPLKADLFSTRGLRSFGPALRRWQSEWFERLAKNPPPASFELPTGKMEAAGYVVVQPSLYGDEAIKAYQTWLERLPGEYVRALGLPPIKGFDPRVHRDPRCLAVVRHYGSLVAMARAAQKPIFHLSPADGALGSHAAAAREAGTKFRDLARLLCIHIGLERPKRTVGAAT